MAKEEELLALQHLRIKVQDLKAIENKLAADDKALRKAQSRYPSAVEVFDREHKSKYIADRIGDEPQKPAGIIKIVIPAYRAKMKAYEQEHARFLSQYNEAEKKYFAEFSDQRKKIESEEAAEIAFDIQAAEKQFRVTKAECDIARAALEADDLLSEKLQKVEIVDELITYFQDQRADSMKEAVNLYFEEQHRQRLEEYAREQVRLTQEAAEQARQAAESADEAAASAREAVDNFEKAMERANEAFEKAEEAYDEAQSAYWAATSRDS